MDGEAPDSSAPSAPSADDLTSLASTLVGIETANPPGNEGPCAEFVVEWFRERDLEVTLVEAPDPDRPQAVATIGDGDPTLVLNAHADVVPAGDPSRWSHHPYAGTVVDGKLYGRGSADTKTNLALAMLTARDLADEIRDGDLEGSLLVQAPMGEETGDLGTRSLLEAGYGGDLAVVLEPTDFRVATRAKGVVTYRVGIAGEASHASRPDQGTNAVDEARAVLEAIDGYDARLRERSDPRCGRAYATVTEFAAGTEANLAVVPERAELLLDRRILPDEDLETVERELEALFEDLEREGGLEIDRELVQHYASASIPDDSPLARRLRGLSAEVADAPDEPWGMEAATDAREFVADGVEAIVWGPGELAQAHTIDERVDLADAELGLAVLKRATREILSGEHPETGSNR